MVEPVAAKTGEAATTDAQTARVESKRVGENFRITPAPYESKAEIRDDPHHSSERPMWSYHSERKRGFSLIGETIQENPVRRKYAERLWGE
jgi:hypothetical protein